MFDVWKNVLEDIKQVVPQTIFSTFFSTTTLKSIDDGIVKVGGVPNLFISKQLSTKYDKVVKDALLKNGVEFSSVEYVVSSSSAVKKGVKGREITPEEIKSLNKPFKNPSLKSMSPSIRSFSTNLKPDYTLDSFVIGSNNELAVSVAKNVIDYPGKKYNPFFLYGGPGLGKTHLVQAIGNELLKRNPSLKVLYVTTNHFYSEFIEMIRKNKGDDFAKKYQKLDVLIIDDFQQMVKKDRSQEAFFNIFNDLHQADKQIIVTSDRLPSQIATLDERLATRLTWAGAIDLQMPGFEDRCAILKSIADYKGIEIEDEAIEYLAENVKTNIRDLEGELMRLQAFSEYKNMSPLEVINGGFLGGSTHDRSHGSNVQPKQIVEKVAKNYGLTVSEMCGKSRVSHIKTARQVAMFLLSEELGLSTTKIALEVGVKDHTTVMHGIKKIKEDLKLDFGLREQIAAIKENLYA